MDDLDVFLAYFQAATSLFIGGAIIYMHVRDRRAREWARGSEPIPARVLDSRRYETESRRGDAFHVETRFEVPGLGILMHHAVFPTQGKALLHARIHKEGSVHPVVPNLVETGQVFLPSDLRESSSGWLMAGVGGLLLALGLYAFVSIAFSAE